MKSLMFRFEIALAILVVGVLAGLVGMAASSGTTTPAQPLTWPTLSGQWAQPLGPSTALYASLPMRPKRFYVSNQACCLTATAEAGVDIKFRVTDDAADGAICRVALMQLIGKILATVGTADVAVDSEGVKTATIGGVHLPGYYWIGIVSNGAPILAMTNSNQAYNGGVFGVDPKISAATGGFSAWVDLPSMAIPKSIDTSTLTIDYLNKWFPFTLSIGNHE